MIFCDGLVKCIIYVVKVGYFFIGIGCYFVEIGEIDLVRIFMGVICDWFVNNFDCVDEIYWCNCFYIFFCEEEMGDLVFGFVVVVKV